MKNKNRLIIGLNTKDANDASGHRTSAIWQYFRHIDCHLYVIESHKKTTEKNISQSKIGFLYKFLKSKNLLRALFELVLALEFIILNRALIKKTDWFWISSPPFIYSIILLAYLKRKNKEIIFDVKDIYPEVFYMTGIVSEKSPIYKSVLKFTHKQLEDITIVGATIGISKYYSATLKTQKVFTLLNGSELVAKSANKDHTDPFTAIFHGRLGKLQNVMLLRELILGLPNVTFIILSKDELFLKKVRPQNVKEFGIKKGEELIRLIQGAHIGLSFRDNSDLSKISNAVKIFDYVACGTPVLSAPFTEIEYHLKNSGLLKSFEYNNNVAIRDFIHRLSEDREFYLSSFPNAGQACHKFFRKGIVEKFFSQNDQIL